MGGLIKAVCIVVSCFTFIKVIDSRSLFSGLLNGKFGYLGLESDLKCSRVWNFFGTQIHLGQNEAYGDLGVYHFVPITIRMRNWCVLSMVDDVGDITVVESNITSGTQCWYRPLAYACCECYGCYGAITPTSESACAVMYEHADCSACLGLALEAKVGDETQLMPPELDNSISSIIIKPGCQLEVYKNANFSGDAAIATGMIEVLSPDWNDQISSYKCTCQGSIPTSIPSTLPPLPSTPQPTKLTEGPTTQITNGTTEQPTQLTEGPTTQITNVTTERETEIPTTQMVTTASSPAPTEVTKPMTSSTTEGPTESSTAISDSSPSSSTIPVYTTDDDEIPPFTIY